MSGSKQYWLYVTDNAQNFVFQADESNIEAVGETDPVGITQLYGIPSNLKMRYARYRTASGKRSRNIPIGNVGVLSTDIPASLDFSGPSESPVIDAGENVYALKAIIGEVFSVQISTPDTGLTDGD